MKFFLSYAHFKNLFKFHFYFQKFRSSKNLECIRQNNQTTRRKKLHVNKVYSSANNENDDFTSIKFNCISCFLHMLTDNICNIARL